MTLVSVQRCDMIGDSVHCVDRSCNLYIQLFTWAQNFRDRSPTFEAVEFAHHCFETSTQFHVRLSAF